jgi:rhomboid-like protein
MIWIVWKRPEMWRSMNRYFLLSAGHPNTFSVVGGIFSHQTFTHLASNMAYLLCIGIPRTFSFYFLIQTPFLSPKQAECACILTIQSVHEEITRGPFLSLFISTGIFASLATLTYSVLTRDLLVATIGASGAVFGIVGCYLTLQPERSLGFQDYSATYYTWIALAMIGAFEVWSFAKGRKGRKFGGGKDHLAHLGGLVSGAGAGFALRKRAEADRVGVVEDDEDGVYGDGERAVMEVSTASGPHAK